MDDPILQASGLCHRFDRRDALLFQDVSLAVARGKATVLIGPNGSGKSTLISLLAGISRPESGTVLLNGAPLSAMPARLIAQHVGLLPQSPEAAEGLRVRELIALGRSPHRGPFGLWSQADERAVVEALAEVDLVALADRPLSSLSGGQRQRAFIGLVLAQRPKALLLDEPTSYLDIAQQVKILAMLDRLKSQQKLTLIASLHDIGQAAEFADWLVVMAEGRIIAQGPPDQIVTEQLLAEVFGLEARVREDAETGRLLIIPLRPADRPHLRSVAT